jgi:hypothetical protein
MAGIRELIPPSNPEYPWVPKDWQLLCYYCNQPIYETRPVAGFRQRTLYMRGRWRHTEGDSLACRPDRIRPESEIDGPRCHVCGAARGKAHAGACSFAGPAPYYATPFSQKEDEAGRWEGRKDEDT